MADHARERVVEPGLYGVWTVDRRRSAGEVRFERVTFYRDGRFGTVAVDHLTAVYGSWWVERGDDAGDLLRMRFDFSPSPSASFRLRFETPVAGPCVLSEESSGTTRVLLERALPIEAALVGEWRAYAGALEGSEVGLDGLELLRNGRYLLHPAGASPRPGRWGFARESGGAHAPVTGSLVLDPSEVAHPRLTWKAEVSARGFALLTIRTAPGARAIVLARREIAMPAASILGQWRLLPPGGPGAPDEVLFQRGGRLEVLPHAGAARAHGRWAFLRTDPAARALRGVLSMSVFASAPGLARERWHVTLPFNPRADLALVAEDGRQSLRYRRLFR